MINGANANEREIREIKAPRRFERTALPGSNVSWGSINFEMKLTLPFVISASDETFPDEPVKWVQEHHGHANVMFVMGGVVRGGKVYGDWPRFGGRVTHRRPRPGANH